MTKLENKDPKSYAQQFVAQDRLGSLLGGKFISLSSDECIYEYEVNPNHLNPNGILHGGALFTIMDSSQGMLIHYVLDEAYKAAATGTATIKYLAPLQSGKIRIHTVIKEKQNRKFFVVSTATDRAKEVAVLEEIWIGLLK